jgi:tetratricopeptide (TPR) repeat protein
MLVALLSGAVALARAVPQRPATEARAAPSEAHSDTILVFAFENDSKMANLDWLGEGLSELTNERLEDRDVNVLSREDRAAVLERMGLPDSARFSHATMVKIAGEAGADAIVYGRFASDGQTVTLEARVLRLSPASLSPALKETSALQDAVRAHARLAWQILCAIGDKLCPAQGASRDESGFSEPPATLRPDALENFVRGMAASQNEDRLRLLRESARLEPAWDRPAYELGQIYFERRDCDSALVWFSRVPPNRPDGPVASFAAGVCHLARNDAARAEAAFSGLLDRARKTAGKEALPDLPEAHNNLGVSELRLGKWPEAAAEFQKAAALEPDDGDYSVNIALTKLIQKDAAGAVDPLQKARKIEPDDKDARALLVAALDSLGRTQEAAAVRAEVAENADKQPAVNLQDPTVLVRLARVVRNLDRALLRPSAESAEGQAPASKGTRKTGCGVGCGGQP